MQIARGACGIAARSRAARRIGPRMPPQLRAPSRPRSSTQGEPHRPPWSWIQKKLDLEKGHYRKGALGHRGLHELPQTHADATTNHCPNVPMQRVTLAP
eukprot:5524631-Pyramimonas_sp.AAC.2